MRKKLYCKKKRKDFERKYLSEQESYCFNASVLMVTFIESMQSIQKEDGDDALNDDDDSDIIIRMMISDCLVLKQTIPNRDSVLKKNFH